MLEIPVLGLVLALLGLPAILGTVRYFGGEPLGLWTRLSLWGLAGAILVIAANSFEDWGRHLGLLAPAWHSMAVALVAAVLILVGWPATQFLQKKSGRSATTATATFRKVAALPSTYRLFLVVTAGVTEEVLYRGYGIGIGKLLLGGTSIALAVSLCAFVAAHLRWGLAHLLSVLWAGAALSILFVLTNSLLACIIAHVLVDAFGFLFVPYVMASRAERTISEGNKA